MWKQTASRSLPPHFTCTTRSSQFTGILHFYYDSFFNHLSSYHSLDPLPKFGIMASPKLVNIDPTGNLLIISEVANGSTLYHFRVSSKILSLASPVFASLFPNATSHAGQYLLTIKDDVPETVGTLLELCHFGRKAPLPYALLRGLYSLAELSQKYAIASPLVPWISIWAEPLHTLGGLDFSKGEELHMWLTIACVYNQGPLFLKITKQAILTGSAEMLDLSKWQYPYSEIIGSLIPP